MPKSKSSKKSKSMVMNVAQLSTALVSFTLSNIVVLFFASKLFPRAIVLGTHLLSPFVSMLYSMVVLSVIVVGFMPVTEWIVEKQNLKLKDQDWLLMFWVINAGALWLVARMAEMLGLGLSSWLVVVVLALALNLAQGVVMMRLVSKVK